MNDPASRSNANSDSADEGKPSRLWRWGRRVLWGLGGLVGTLLLLIGLLLGGLQTETGATAAAQFLARQANPLPQTTLTVERASGSWVRSLRLTNVSLTRTDSASGARISMAQIDTVSVEYSLGALLRGHIHLTDVALHRPAVTTRQAPDSTWDWLRLLPDSEEDSPSDTSASSPVQIDRLRLSDGQFTAEFYAGKRDSTTRVRNLTLQAHALQFGPSVEGRLDTLGLRGHLPADSSTVTLATKGHLSSSRLQLDTLDLRSPRSHVQGHGTARLPTGPTDTLEDVALTLRATPLVLGDLTALVPTLNVVPREAVTFDARVTGSGQELALTTEAHFSGGGHLTVHATATPRLSGPTGSPPLRYALDAELQHLTTSLLGPLDPAENTLNGTIDGTLQGPTLAALSGAVEAHLTDTRYLGIESPALTFESSVQNGQAELDLEGRVNGTVLSVRGSSRPFDDAPSIDLTARVRNLSLETFAPEAGVTGTFTATTTLEADSLTTPAARYDVTTTLDTSQLGLQPIDGGTVSLAMTSTQLQFSGALAFPEGRFEAAGHAARDGSGQFALERGRFDHVNVAALLGDSTRSRITGTLQAAGHAPQLSAPETIRGTASLSIQEARYGPHRMDSSRTRLRLEAGQLTTDASLRLNGSEWRVVAEGRPFAPVPFAEVTRGRFRKVDIGPFLQDSTQSSALQGTFQGRIEGRADSTLQVQGELTLDTSRVNQQRLASGTVDVRFRNGALRSTVALSGINDERIQFSLSARPLDDVPTFRLSEGTFEGLDVGALVGMPSLRSELNGAVTLRGRGATLPNLVVDSELNLRTSTINRARLSKGRLTFSADRGRLATEGSFTVAGGSLQLSGHVDSLDHVPAYALRTKARSLDVGALTGLDTLQAAIGTLRGRVEGRGAFLDSLTASVHLSATSARVDRLRLDSLTMSGALRKGRLSVDTLSVRTNAFEGQGQGPLAVRPGAGPSNFSFEARITDVAPIRPLLGINRLQLRKGRIAAHVYGAADRQRFDGSATFEGLIYEKVRLGQTDLSFNGQRGFTQPLDRFELEGETRYLSLPGITATGSRLNANYNGTSVDVSANVRLDQKHRGSLQATVHPAPDSLSIQLRRLDLRLGPDQWSLSRSTTITVDDLYRVDPLHLESDSQSITAEGVVAPTGPQDFAFATQDVRLGGIAPLLGLQGLDGRLTSTLTFTGKASAPRLDGQLDLALRSEGADVGTVHLEVAYRDLALDLTARMTDPAGNVLTASGSVPVDLRLNAPTPVDISERRVRIDASTSQFPLNWIDPFLDPESVRSVSGTLVGDVSVRGTLDQPTLSGSVSVTEVGAHLPPLNTTYQDGALQLQLSEDRIQIEKAVIRTPNGGSLRAQGGVDFPELTIGNYNLDLNASNLLAINTRAYRRAIVDGQMTLRGSTQRPTLGGRIEVKSGNVYYSEALAEGAASLTQVSLTPQDQLLLEERFGLRLNAADTTTVDLYEAAAMDLTVRIRRDTWLRSNSNPEMNVQFSGRLDVQKAHHQDPQIFGTIDVIEGRSTVQQFGQEFQITEGTLTFNGDPSAPYLDLTAVYEQRARGTQGTEVRITLSLTGRPDNLSPSLTSEPPMSTRNIFSYLATGRPADALFSGDSEGGSLATRVALGQASNFVENLAASELGLDVVRLQVRTEGTSYLTVGRYLTPQFFAALEQPVITSSPQGSRPSAFIPDVTLEYQLTDYLLLRSLSGQQALQLNLLFEYAY